MASDLILGGPSFSARAVTAGDITGAVAEPEAYAMLPAGLGLVGFIARRRSLIIRKPIDPRPFDPIRLVLHQKT